MSTRLVQELLKSGQRVAAGTSASLLSAAVELAGTAFYRDVHGKAALLS